MGFFSNIGAKLSNASNWIGSKVGGALTTVGSKVSGVAGKVADLAAKGAMVSAFVQPELAPVLGSVAAVAKGVQTVANTGTALGNALQARDLAGTVQAGRALVQNVQQATTNFRNRGNY